jgi:hypothetical protein
MLMARERLARQIHSYESIMRMDILFTEET